MKKSLALTLTLGMTIGLLAGCGGQNPSGQQNDTGSQNDTGAKDDAGSKDDADSKDNADASDAVTEELEPVTLKWYFPGEEMEGTSDVVEAFNARLAEVLPNTTVEFTFVGSFDPYGQQWPLLLAGGEEMDIAWEGWNTPLLQDVEDGNVLPLTGLIEQYAPNLVKEMEIWQDDYDCVTLEGEIYAIPSIQPNSVRQSSTVDIDEDIYEYFDVAAILDEAHANDKTTPRLLDLFEEGIQAAIDARALKVGDNSWYIVAESFISLSTRGYVRLDRSAHGGTWSEYYVDPAVDNPEILYKYEIPEVKEAVERLKEMRAKGWFTESQAAGQIQEGANCVFNANPNPQGLWTDLVDEKGVKTTINGDDGRNKYVLLMEEPEQVYVGVSSFGYATAQVIPYTSKNPERAIMLLNLLHDEVGTVGNDLVNLLCYGFESTSEEAAAYGWSNYTAVEQDGQLYVDTSIRGDAPSKHTMQNWVIGNTFKTMHDGSSLTTSGSKEYALKYWTDVYPNMRQCSVTGLRTDSTEVMDELEAVALVEQEYKDLISYGSGLNTLSECLDKMNASGLDIIKENLQGQIDAYMN